jgi:flagellar P-ring protein precursor FlgI
MTMRWTPRPARQLPLISLLTVLLGATVVAQAQQPAGTAAPIPGGNGNAFPTPPGAAQPAFQPAAQPAAMQPAAMQPAAMQPQPGQQAPTQPPAASALPNTAGSTLPRPPLGRGAKTRIKDIAFIDGDRVNHVSGEGLVFGLAGTGGRAEQTRLMAQNYYLRKGVRVDTVNTINMSAVMVMGKIPAHARVGETFLATVSVADDATSLRGGTLSRTALRGIDDEIYAVAQGSIIGAGVAIMGGAATVQMNHPTVGVVEAIVEREVDCEKVFQEHRIRLVLRNKAYSTATQIENVLNRIFPGHARALDSGTVEVLVPEAFASSIPGFVSIIGNLEIEPDIPARVVINQKTGTVVMGHHVTLSRVMFASENIVIATNETPVASQPNPFSRGRTAILPRTELDILETGGTYNLLSEGLTVGELATALNTLAVSPNTLINIMTSLRNQGALQAELVIE